MGQRVRPTPRVRTRRTNRQEPVLLSSMNPEDFNVRAGEKKTIVCPACGTWRRIMGDADLKIREHPQHTPTAEARCGGSNQRVVINIDVRRWQARQDRLLRDAMPSENRRAARQHYKPRPAPPTPVHKIVAPATLETARQTYLAHRRGCAACTGSKHCHDGDLLARRYVNALQLEPARQLAHELLDLEERANSRRRAATWPDDRRKQWHTYGGEPTETANNQTRSRDPQSVSDYCGPHVPTEPLRPGRYATTDNQLSRKGKPVSSPTVVAQRPVATDLHHVTVSTICFAPRHYETVVRDDHEDKRHQGARIDDTFVIEGEPVPAKSRKEAMKTQRQAIRAILEASSTAAC